MRNSIPILVAVLASIAGSAGTRAQPYGYYYGQVAPDSYGPLPPDPPPVWLEEGRSVADWDRYRYNYSGTRGRMGLGADPFHPEGPGNFSTPSR